jgi:uncharacterized integral membrane protein (TIGR00698 family)
MQERISKFKMYQKGLYVSVAVAIVAVVISKFIHFNTATTAILLGLLIGNSFYKIFHDKNSPYKIGIKFAEKDLLMFAIALMGINLNFTMLASLGFKTIFMILVAMGFTIFMGLFLGKLFGLNKKLSLMLGIGNAVCGSSAIAATSGIAKVKNDDIAISIVLVNLMGTIGIFLAPFIALQLGFNDVEGGTLAGNTLQAVGQAVAAGFSISPEAGEYATVVKMGRVLMIAPVVFVLIYLAKHESIANNESIDEKAKVPFPKFILWFLFFSGLASFGLLPKFLEEFISTSSHYIALVAMSAIGLMIHFKTIIQTGGVAFKVSLLLFMLQLAFTSLMILFL